MSFQTHDFEKLKPVRDNLLRMCNEPEVAITNEITRLLCNQIPGTHLLSFKVSSLPELVFAGKESDDGLLTVSKFGIAIPFSAHTCVPGCPTTSLTGVFTWTISDVGKPEVVRSRFWLDVNGDIASLGKNGELVSRMYQFPSAS